MILMMILILHFTLVMIGLTGLECLYVWCLDRIISKTNVDSFFFRPIPMDANGLLKVEIRHLAGLQTVKTRSAFPC